jgi:hypothetical protein
VRRPPRPGRSSTGRPVGALRSPRSVPPTAATEPAEPERPARQAGPAGPSGAARPESPAPRMLGGRGRRRDLRPPSPPAHNRPVSRAHRHIRRIQCHRAPRPRAVALSSALAVPGDPAVGPAADAGGVAHRRVVAPAKRRRPVWTDAARSAEDTGTEARDGGCRGAGRRPGARGRARLRARCLEPRPRRRGAGGPFGGACSPDFGSADGGGASRSEPGISIQGTPNHRSATRWSDPRGHLAARALHLRRLRPTCPTRTRSWLRRCPAGSCGT